MLTAIHLIFKIRSSLFNNGVMSAFFRLTGNFPLSILRLVSSHKTLVYASAFSFVYITVSVIT